MTILFNKIYNKRTSISYMLLIYLNSDVSFTEMILEIEELIKLLEDWEIMKMGRVNKEN